MLCSNQSYPPPTLLPTLLTPFRLSVSTFFFFSFLFICLSRPRRTDLPACVLVVSRVVTTDFRTTVNTCMLQSRGGARTSKPLFHRFLIERKEWNVSSLATSRPYCLIHRSATKSVCRPVVVDYTVTFASSLLTEASDTHRVRVLDCILTSHLHILFNITSSHVCVEIFTVAEWTLMAVTVEDISLRWSSAAMIHALLSNDMLYITLWITCFLLTDLFQIFSVLKNQHNFFILHLEGNWLHLMRCQYQGSNCLLHGCSLQ